MVLRELGAVTLTLEPKRVARWLAWAVVFLTLAHLAGQSGLFYFGWADNSLVKAFDLDLERSVPSLYALVQWLVCVVLLAVIAVSQKQQGARYGHWLGLVLLFAFFAADEFLAIHETMSKPIRAALDTSGLLFFAWVIPYAVGVVVLVVVYARFVLRLPPKTRTLFIVAGLMLVAGALGIEAVAGRYVESHGRDALYHLLFVTVEEFLEMSALVVFIYALSEYMSSELGLSEIRIHLPKGD